MCGAGKLVFPVFEKKRYQLLARSENMRQKPMTAAGLGAAPDRRLPFRWPLDVHDGGKLSSGLQLKSL